MGKFSGTLIHIDVPVFKLSDSPASAPLLLKKYDFYGYTGKMKIASREARIRLREILDEEQLGWPGCSCGEHAQALIFRKTRVTRGGCSRLLWLLWPPGQHHQQVARFTPDAWTRYR